jgi:outer membrane immunogenic protein
MKKILLATAAFVSFAAGSATAADMPVKYSPPVARCANFGGFYFGGHVAYNSSTHVRNDQDGFLTDNASYTLSDSRFGGGLQTGYNWQGYGNCTLWGIELDSSWSNLQDEIVQNAFGQDHFLHVNNKWISTLRGRAGHVVENTLLYVTAGLAWGRFETTVQNHNAASPVFLGDFSNNRAGLVAGFGAEQWIANNWTLKAEALYMKFASYDNSTSIAFIPAPFKWSSSDEVLSVRIGVNYIFGGKY